MSTPASPPLEVMVLLWHILNDPRGGAYPASDSDAERRAVELGLAVTDGRHVWVAQHAEVPDAPPDICTARPLPSCSRPDGQCLRHWDREPWWTNTGIDCEVLS